MLDLWLSCCDEKNCYLYFEYPKHEPVFKVKLSKSQVRDYFGIDIFPNENEICHFKNYKSYAYHGNVTTTTIADKEGAAQTRNEINSINRSLNDIRSSLAALKIENQDLKLEIERIEKWLNIS